MQPERLAHAPAHQVSVAGPWESLAGHRKGELAGNVGRQRGFEPDKAYRVPGDGLSARKQRVDKAFALQALYFGEGVFQGEDV